MTTPTCLPRAREEGVLANCCLISQLGRRERSEQGLQCRLVWADERVCLRRAQHCFEELVVRLLYGRQVCAENRRGAYVTFNDTATTEIYTLSLHDALPADGI